MAWASGQDSKLNHRCYFRYCSLSFQITLLTGLRDWSCAWCHAGLCKRGARGNAALVCKPWVVEACLAATMSARQTCSQTRILIYIQMIATIRICNHLRLQCYDGFIWEKCVLPFFPGGDTDLVQPHRLHTRPATLHILSNEWRYLASAEHLQHCRSLRIWQAFDSTFFSRYMVRN